MSLVLYSVSIVVFAPQYGNEISRLQFVAEADALDDMLVELGDLTVLSGYERLDILVFVVATIFLGLELAVGL